MKVLVTGASGFVGAEVVRAIAALGHHPIAAVRRTSNDRRLPRHVEHVVLDLEDDRSIAAALEQSLPDAIIHSAAYGAVSAERDAIRMVKVNVRGSLALHAAANRAKVERFVHVGTAMEYGSSETALAEDAPLHPRGAYAASKAAATWALSEHGNPVLLRLFNLFGPRDDRSRVAMQIVLAARARTNVDLTAGNQRRDFSFVRDTARRIAAVATLPAQYYPAGGTFNVASGNPVTVHDFAVAFAEALGARELLRFGALATRPDAPSDLFANIARLTDLLNSAGRADALVLTPLGDAARACLEGLD